MYGPIPYSKIISKTGEVSLTVPYDSQEEVYKQMFKELDEVSDVLKENLNLSTEAFRKFDDVYQGDLSKWLKFTNSLKLRMAMRLTYVPGDERGSPANSRRSRNRWRHYPKMQTTLS